VIDVSGMTPGLEPGDVSQAVLQSLGWFAVLTMASLALVAFVFFTRVRLGRADHASVMSQLASRAVIKL
jgi:hypothetical protein